eukprot:TRINITY_DN10262_c0_g1_i7.p1 TRINITY_DN10262_c0_g1~~TRINITY_DN10262_c0_g1_i7.p1  ORF type:complete len:275 (+),score=26.48 TRINITY_DN10262_c0_g1_i7:215-1039(+)
MLGKGLVDLGLAAQFLDQVLDLLLAGALLQLRLDLIERRRGHRTRVVELDDVVAEIGLDRGLGVFTLLQLAQRFAKRLDVGVRRAPAEFAALVLGARILGGLGQFGEFLALVQLGDDGLGVFFLLDQHVAGLVFGAAEIVLDQFVLSLQLGLADRMCLDVVRQVGADQNGLFGELDLALDVGALVEALLLGFLGKDFATDQFFLDGTLQFRRIRGALSLLFCDEGVIDRLRDRLAIDGGESLGLVGSESRSGNDGTGDPCTCLLYTSPSPRDQA